jgi:hypothetical protein
MPIIGPRITALGDIDFISAHMMPARIIIPLSGHILEKDTRRITAKRLREVPAKGTRRL